MIVDCEVNLIEYYLLLIEYYCLILGLCFLECKLDFNNVLGNDYVKI